MPYRNTIAKGVTAIAGEDPFQLFGGDGPVVTGQEEFGADCAQFVPVARQTANGKLYPWAPAAEDGTEKALFVSAQPVDVSEQAIAPIYIEANFNPEALTWPAGIDTLAEQKAAFDGTSIRITRVL